MDDAKKLPVKHLAEEARERIGMGGEPAPVESRHLSSCESCRREVAEIGSLQMRFSGLPVLEPSAGFADRVMARVSLPAPLWVRALDGLRVHPRRVAALAAVLVATVAGTFSWLTAYPQVTPGVLLRLAVERGSGLLWDGIVTVATVAYDSGLAALFGAFRADLTAWSAVGALATLVLVGLVSMWMLLKLMEVSPRAVVAGVRRDG